MEFECSTLSLWREALSSYSSRIQSLNKPNLVSLDDFYRNELPSLLHQRNPSPFITTSELSDLMRWKLTRGKWRYLYLSLSLSLSPSTFLCVYINFADSLRSAKLVCKIVNLRPRLLDFVSALDEAVVKSASQKAFQALPDISKAISELTVLKGVGPATASAVLAAYAPDVAPFMSDEAMVAALGNSKDYTLKQYLLFANKLQEKAKELTAEGESFTPSDVERALWSGAVGAKLPSSEPDPDLKTDKSKNPNKRRRKR